MGSFFNIDPHLPSELKAVKVYERNLSFYMYRPLKLDWIKFSA